MALLFFLGFLAIIVGVFAKTRGRSGLGWFFLSCLISPILTGLLVAVLPKKTSIGLPDASEIAAVSNIDAATIFGEVGITEAQIVAEHALGHTDAQLVAQILKARVAGYTDRQIAAYFALAGRGQSPLSGQRFDLSVKEILSISAFLIICAIFTYGYFFLGKPATTSRATAVLAGHAFVHRFDLSSVTPRVFDDRIEFNHDGTQCAKSTRRVGAVAWEEGGEIGTVKTSVFKGQNGTSIFMGCLGEDDEYTIEENSLYETTLEISYEKDDTALSPFPSPPPAQPPSQPAENPPPPPDYTASASIDPNFPHALPAGAQHGETGTAILTVYVEPEGWVSKIELTKNSGYPSLDQASVDAVRAWHFLPAIKDGKPVPSSFIQTFNFEPPAAPSSAVTPPAANALANVDMQAPRQAVIYPNHFNEQGTVVLLVYVDGGGKSVVEVAQTSGFIDLDNSARDAISTWHFLPALQDGKPIAGSRYLQVVFDVGTDPVVTYTSAPATPAVVPQPVPELVPVTADMQSLRPAPVYSQGALQRHERGTVVLEIFVNPDFSGGSTVGVSVVRSSGHLDLDEAARSTIQTWRFLPAMQNGKPIAASRKLLVQFAGGSNPVNVSYAP